MQTKTGAKRKLAILAGNVGLCCRRQKYHDGKGAKSGGDRYLHNFLTHI